MARRYGGEYSPTGHAQKDARTGSPPPAPAPQAPQAPQGRPRGRRFTPRPPRERWANFLFFAPLPLALQAFSQPPERMAAMLFAFALLILAAWLTHQGLAAEAAYNARRIARRPAIPRKIFATVLTGAGLFTAGLVAGEGMVPALLYALLGAGLHFFVFGPDPLKNKGMEGMDSFQTERVARAIDEAEKLLEAMAQATARAGDREAEARVARFQETAREMFRTIEEDPRDLTAARRYLSVYLMGARDAAVKFADLHTRSRDAGAKAGFLALLDELEENFAARTRAMLLDDKADLEVEIEVLRERLAREGLAGDQAGARNPAG